MKSSNLFHRVRKVRVSDTVIDQIVSLIDAGTLQIGDTLPSERDLVKQLGIARASVREALRVLEFQGIIEVRQGKGAVIVGDINSLDSGETVRQWFQEHAKAVLDMLEVREALELKAVQLAAKLITPQQVNDLRRILEQSNNLKLDNDLNQLVQLDRRFHSMIVQASGNEILCDLVDMVMQSMISPRRSTLRISGRANRSHQEHHEILDALAEGDMKRAERAMSLHIAHVRQAIMELGNADSRLAGSDPT